MATKRISRLQGRWNYSSALDEQRKVYGSATRVCAAAGRTFIRQADQPLPLGQSEVKAKCRLKRTLSKKRLLIASNRRLRRAALSDQNRLMTKSQPSQEGARTS